MKAWVKVFLFISVLSASLFLCIGYAAFTDSLGALGSVTAVAAENPLTGVYITDVTEAATSNIDKNEFSFITGTTNISNSVSRGTEDKDGVIVYEVTVYNSTNVAYYYRDNYYQTGISQYNGNDYISDYHEGNTISIECIFNTGDEDAKKLMPKESITFKVVYTVGGDIDESIDLNMLVNIRFGVHVSGNDEALDMIEARFLQILNTESTYNYLIDILDNKFDGVNDWSSNYVGNVAGATAGAFSEDSVAVNALFQNHLQMTIDGELKEVTVIIKHEDVDWDTATGDAYVATHPDGGTYSAEGCEMTLYLTIDDLNDPWSYVTVYAMVFTIDRDYWGTGAYTSDWYRTGCAFIGTAEVSDYDGTPGGTGSFRTTTWWPKPNVEYELVPGYHFEIQNGDYVDVLDFEGFSYVASGEVLSWQTPMYAMLEVWNEEGAAVVFDLMNDAKTIIDNKNYAGEGIDRLRAVYDKYYWHYAYLGYPNLNWPYPTVRKFYPAMVELYKVIVSVASDITEIPTDASE